jgi:hypothetical protein
MTNWLGSVHMGIIGSSLLGLAVLGSIVNMFNPHTEMTRAPSMPLIAGEPIYEEESDSEADEAIDLALKHREKHPTLVNGPSDYFKKDLNPTPRIKFINLTDVRVKFIIHPVTWTNWFLKNCKCVVPTPVGSVGIEGDIVKEEEKDKECRLAPRSRIGKRLPDICEFALPSKKVYVSLYIDKAPVFVDREMKAYDTFICRGHIVDRGCTTSVAQIM